MIQPEFTKILKLILKLRHIISVFVKHETMLKFVLKFIHLTYISEKQTSLKNVHVILLTQIQPPPPPPPMVKYVFVYCP